MDSYRVYLATDLDRTLLPNGDRLEPAGAREKFAALIARDDIGLIYVSGRDLSLVSAAIQEFSLPVPDYIVADVGSSVYRRQGGRWQILDEWQVAISRDWAGLVSGDLRELLGEIHGMELQAESKQGLYKLSFQRRPAGGINHVVDVLSQKLDELHSKYKARCRVVLSVDETSDTGLVDVLPVSANKCAALEFLAKSLSVDVDHIVFSGDSGNDLDVLLSPLPATLVGNASAEVRKIAMDALVQRQVSKLYLAKAYYAAGILEGFYHYFPEYAEDQQEGVL